MFCKEILYLYQNTDFSSPLLSSRNRNLLLLKDFTQVLKRLLTEVKTFKSIENTIYFGKPSFSTTVMITNSSVFTERRLNARKNECQLYCKLLEF